MGQHRAEPGPERQRRRAQVVDCARSASMVADGAGAGTELKILTFAWPRIGLVGMGPIAGSSTPLPLSSSAPEGPTAHQRGADESSRFRVAARGANADRMRTCHRKSM